MKTATTKTCTKCGEEKELTEYYMRPSKGTVDAQCKACVLAKNTVWREANRELKRKRNREWWAENREEIAERRRKAYHANPEHYRRVKREHRANNREKYKEYDRNYKLKHPEKKRQSDKNWYENNKERHREHGRNYKLRNPEKIRATANRAKAKRRAVESDSHTLAELHAYWRANGIDPKRCTYCDAWHTKWANNWKSSVGDHVVPIAKGGKDVLENMMPCCSSCNSSKGPKMLGEEWIPPNER